MKVSKTKFMYFSKNKHVDKFMSEYRRIKDETGDITEEQLNELMEFERLAKMGVLFKESVDKLEEVSLEEAEELASAFNDEYMEAMLPFFKEVEQLATRKIENTFGGLVIASRETFSQKYFQYEKDGYSFFSFLDAYQEDDDYIRIVETKATTSSSFYKVGYKQDGVMNSVFTKLPSGDYILKEEVEGNLSPKYYENRKKLFDYEKKTGVGKYIYDLAYQNYVIEKNIKSDKPRKYYLAVLNHEYVFDGKYDSDGKPIYPDDIIRLIDLTKIVNEYKDILNEQFDNVIFKLDHMDDELIKLDEQLMITSAWDKVKFEELIGIEDPITDYTHSHHGFKEEGIKGKEEAKYSIKELIEQGILTIKDVPDNLLNRPNNKIQKQAVIDQELHVNTKDLKRMLNTIKYPLYHLDFETFCGPLPRFRGETPYTQSVYQFSLHIEHEESKCDKDKDHLEFLAPDHRDYREEIARLLCEYIKDDGGHVLAYNFGFEKKVIKDLANLFPKYKEKLMKIHDRVIDLIHFLRNNKDLAKLVGLEKDTYLYYHPAQKGSFSIKKVLPTLSELSYSSLDVQNGNEALVSYLKLPKLKEESEAAFQKEYKAMLEYCKQDTWAMFVVLEKLRELIK